MNCNKIIFVLGRRNFRIFADFTGIFSPIYAKYTANYAQGSSTQVIFSTGDRRPIIIKFYNLDNIHILNLYKQTSVYRIQRIRIAAMNEDRNNMDFQESQVNITYLCILYEMTYIYV